MEHPRTTAPAHNVQSNWARSRRVQPWPDRYLLLELAIMADGARRVRASDTLLSGLTGIPTGAVSKALDRMERRSILQREHGDDGCDYVVLGYPPADSTNGDVCAHVRGEGGV